MILERTADAQQINAILNHPAVRPDVAGQDDGVLDVADVLARPGHVCLVGQHGGFLIVRYDAGIYEVHTAILPVGRGEWARDAAAECTRFMFTRTDCVDLITRVPQGHIAAKALTEMNGFRLQFTTPPDTLFRERLVPCHIYCLTIQEWATRAAGMEESGATFHAWLTAQVGEGHGAPHENDPAHNRVVGVTLAMVEAGQPLKGVVWYNRCAIAARHPTIGLLSLDPPQIRFDAGILTMTPQGLQFSRPH